MERFQNLSWHPALEDMIDNVFIRDERMERESAMYRIMNDCFTNPFEDIESEYADVNVELIEKYLREDGDPFMEDEDQQKVKNADNSCLIGQEKSYVPGIRRLSFNFPRRSHLDKAQHAMCLRVLLKSFNEERKTLNEEERTELQTYMTLQKTISEEQKEFLEFIKEKWNDTYNWSIKCNKYVAIKWKTKMQRFKKLPRYYVESINIPLSVQQINYKTKNIKVKFMSCLRQGSFSEVTLPKLDRRHMLYITPEMLFERYPCVAPDKVMQHFRLPVSEDIHCENLAVVAGADFVISSSGLKCLLNNIDPSNSNSWTIPVVVKSHDGKNIVYIDKKLPPAIATIPQKNTWIYKYILRYYFCDVKNESPEKTKCKKEDKPENAANPDSENYSDSSNGYLKDYEEALYLSDTDNSEKSDNLASGTTKTETDSKIEKGQNVSYNFFTIGPMDHSDHDRVKHGVKEYKMLVRTKTDGIEMLLNKESQSLILAPKMEHQLGIGAEAVTLEEGLHQWASLKFRPETSLARVRIAADTSEIIQIERLTTNSLGNQIKRLYNVKVEDSLSILHNIIEGLSSLTPGQYIMRYISQNGPFACVYKETECTQHRKNVFDLHTICQSMVFQTTPTTPWPPIDNMLTTPANRCFQKMPAMFNPGYLTQKTGRPRGRPKKNANVAKNQVSVSPRRSDRLKKENET